MKYVEYRDSVFGALRRHAGGLTRAQLQAQLELPYDRPCPEWTRRLEEEIGLRLVKGAGRALVWKLGRRGRVFRPSGGT